MERSLLTSRPSMAWRYCSTKARRSRFSGLSSMSASLASIGPRMNVGPHAAAARALAKMTMSLCIACRSGSRVARLLGARLSARRLGVHRLDEVFVFLFHDLPLHLERRSQLAGLLF